jgi:hypothetical protein
MRPALLVLTLLVACHRPPAGDEAVSSAKTAVGEFFTVAEGGDCNRLKPLMLQPDGCDNLMRQFQETHTKLKQLTLARTDGRTANAVLVNATVEFNKNEHHWIVRATWKDGSWKISL